MYSLYIGSDNRTHEMSKSQENEIISFLSNYFKSFTYSKTNGIFHGEKEDTLIVEIGNTDVFKVIDAGRYLLKALNQNGIGLKIGKDYIRITESLVLCYGTTRIILKETIQEKHKGALKEFMERFFFAENSKYVYFTSHPAGNLRFDGFSHKFFTYQVNRYAGEYITGYEAWTYYACEGSEESIPPTWIESIARSLGFSVGSNKAERIPPAWAEGYFDFGDFKFAIW